jgi:hypothetical protein
MIGAALAAVTVRTALFEVTLLTLLETTTLKVVPLSARLVAGVV